MLSCPAPVPAVGLTATPAASHSHSAVLLRPVAAGSLSVLLLAALGPLLTSVTVYVVLPPALTLVTPSVLVTARSATGPTVSVSVRELLVRSESVVPLGTVAVNVFATLPLVAVTLAVTVKLRLPPLGSVGTTTVPASRLAMLNWPAPVPVVGHTAPPAAVH